MKNFIIMLVCIVTLSIAGCGFLNPVQKKDSLGNPVVDAAGKPVIVAAGSQYLESAQGVLQVASAFPVFGTIASGLAALLGVGVVVSNRIANNRQNALIATVAGVESFSANFTKVKSAIMETVGGLKNDELTKKVEGLLSVLSVKSVISSFAGKIGIWKYLDAFVQKLDPKRK